MSLAQIFNICLLILLLIVLIINIFAFKKQDKKFKNELKKINETKEKEDRLKNNLKIELIMGLPNMYTFSFDDEKISLPPICYDRGKNKEKITYFCPICYSLKNYAKEKNFTNEETTQIDELDFLETKCPLCGINIDWRI